SATWTVMRRAGASSPSPRTVAVSPRTSTSTPRCTDAPATRRRFRGLRGAGGPRGRRRIDGAGDRAEAAFLEHGARCDREHFDRFALAPDVLRTELRDDVSRAVADGVHHVA